MFCVGAPSRNRTYDPLLKRELLYRLSYGGNCFFKNLLPAALFKYNSLFRASFSVEYSSVYATVISLRCLVESVFPFLCSLNRRERLLV